MKNIFVVLVIGMISAGVTAASDVAYLDGMKALKAGDYQTALDKLEAAVGDDPDNLRFANDYRQAVIQTKEYDRCLSFFDQIISAHPRSANAHLNYGLADVDKMPAAGSITQLILANSALAEFSKAIEIQPSWLAFYTRGLSYLYWPREFQRTHLGVEDLEKALTIQKAGANHKYYVRTYIALGDGYWKMDDVAKANGTWNEGLKIFADDPQLKARVSKSGDDLRAIIEDSLDYTQRIDTNLHELWTE